MKLIHLLLLHLILASTFQYVSLSPWKKVKAFFGIRTSTPGLENHNEQAIKKLCPIDLCKRQNYEIDDKLDEGVFGVVYKAVHKKFGTIALKVMEKNKLFELYKMSGDSINAEIKALKTLKSSKPPIAPKFYEAFQDTKNIYIAMELLEGPPLCSKIPFKTEPITYLKEMKARNLTALLISMIFKMQKQYKLLHMDLKSDNILLDNAGHIRFIDFGACQFLNEKNDEILTARKVRPPSVRVKPTEHSEFDFWAVVVNVVQYLIGAIPQQELFYKPLYHKQIEITLINNGMSAVGASFLSGMSNFNIDERLGYKNKDAFRNHPWFKDFIYNGSQFAAINVDTAFLNSFFF